MPPPQTPAPASPKVPPARTGATLADGDPIEPISDVTGGEGHEGEKDVVIDLGAEVATGDRSIIAHLKLQQIIEAILLKLPLQ